MRPALLAALMRFPGRALYTFRAGTSAIHFGRSRQSMTASVAAITQAMTLAQNGITMPFTVTVHPIRTRSNCISATSAKTAMAAVVAGFMSWLRCINRRG